MSLKVIHVLPHSPPVHLLGVRAERSVSTGKKPYWVGFWDKDWHALVAKHVKAATGDYELECWRPYRWADKTYSMDMDGITHRAFPSRRVRLGRFDGGEISISMVREMRRQAAIGPLLVHLHSPGRLLCQSLLLSAGIGKVPVVMQTHGTGSHASALRRKPWLALVSGPLTLLERLAVRKADHLFVLKPEDVEDWRGVFGGEIEIQSMGVDFREFRPLGRAKARAALGLEEAGRYILYAGRLEKGKGIEHLLRAHARVLDSYPETRLLVCGTGTQLGALTLLARNLNTADRVEFIGHVDHARLPEYYNAADVFVSATASGEGLGMTLVEALACGTPVVTTGTPGPARVAADFGVSKACLVPYGDDAAIADGIRSVFLNRESWTIDTGRGAAIYGWAAIARHTVEVYEHLFDKYYPGARRTKEAKTEG